MAHKNNKNSKNNKKSGQKTRAELRKMKTETANEVGFSKFIIKKSAAVKQHFFCCFYTSYMQNLVLHLVLPLVSGNHFLSYP